MLLFYVDESGTSLNDQKSAYFVLAALALPASACRMLDTRVSAVKRAILTRVQPEDWEIKGHDIRGGQKFFKSLSWDARLSAIRQVANTVVDLDLRAYVVEVDKREISWTGKTSDDLYRMAFFACWTN